MIEFGAYRYDAESRLLYRGDEEILLPPRVVAVLESLLKRPGKIVPKEDLLASAWEGAFVGEDSLTQAISQLRQALGDDPQRPTYIQTIPRRGYRLIADVREYLDAASSAAGSASESGAPQRRSPDLGTDWPELALSSSPTAAPASADRDVTLPLGPRSTAPTGLLRRWWTWGAVSAVLGLVTTIIVLQPPGPVPTPRPSSATYDIELPPINALTRTMPLDISRNGRYLLLGMRPEVGSPSLWLRRLDDPEERRFVPRGNVSLFFGAVFSPDGNSIAFGNGTGIWKIPLEGGPPFPLAPRAGLGIDWSDDDWIYVSVTSGDGMGGSIQRLRPAGGALQELAAPHLARGETSYDFPHALPDRQALLFNIFRRGRGDRSPIALLDLETGAVQQLGLEGGQPRYLPTGHILYGRDDALWAVPFNVATGQVTGDPRIVQRQVGVARITGSMEATVSATGTLVYVEAPPSRAHRLVVLDHAGNERILREEPGGLHSPRFSPDGERVVAADDNVSPWVYELSQRSWAPVAAEGIFTGYTWADDQTITYSVGTALFSQRIDGRGRPQELWKSEHLLAPDDWSPDGTMLAFQEKSPETGNDIWLLKIEDDGTRRAAPFRNTEYAEGDARFSPDGQWIAYSSNQHGSLQVYLTSVSQPSSHYAISRIGNTAPMWSPDSRRLYFRLGLNMMVVDVDTRDGVSVGEPRILFELARSYSTGYVPSFDISPDGETFITIDTERHVPRTLRVVVDWFEHVRRQF